MLYPSVVDLANGSNRYVLVIATAKRAREIIDDAEKAGAPIPDNSVKDAVADIANGKVTWHIEKNAIDEIV